MEFSAAATAAILMRDQALFAVRGVDHRIRTSLIAAKNTKQRVPQQHSTNGCGLECRSPYMKNSDILDPEGFKSITLVESQLRGHNNKWVITQMTSETNRSKEAPVHRIRLLSSSDPPKYTSAPSNGRAKPVGTLIETISNDLCMCATHKGIHWANHIILRMGVDWNVDRRI
jgi:hypothetical protein